MPSGIALADPATRGALQRYLRSALASALAGAVSLVAVTLVISLHAAHVRHLYAVGIHTPGVIVALQPCACGGPTGVYYLVHGARRYGIETLPRSGPGYYVGERLEVSYDAANPSILRSPAASVPNAWVRPLTLASMFGLVLLAGGLAAARRARRWRLLLAGASWRPYQLTYVPRTRRSRYSTLALTPSGESTEPLLLRLGAVFKWRASMLRTASGRMAWLAGDPASEAVLAVQPGPVLFPLRLIRAKHHERHRAAAAKAQAAQALSPSERRLALEQAHRKSRLRILLVWAALALATVAHPTTVAWLALLAESLTWTFVLLRLKAAHDNAAEECHALPHAAAEAPSGGPVAAN